MRLFLDDLRNPLEKYDFVARSSEAAIVLAAQNEITFISFDHDLGDEDTAMNFCKWLAANYLVPPAYQVHSANPIGKLNIVSFMESWKKSLTLDGE